MYFSKHQTSITCEKSYFICWFSTYITKTIMYAKLNSQKKKYKFWCDEWQVFNFIDKRCLHSMHISDHILLSILAYPSSPHKMNISTKYSCKIMASPLHEILWSYCKAHDRKCTCGGPTTCMCFLYIVSTIFLHKCSLY